MQVRPYHWRPSGSFLAHLLKATTQQHHRALAPTIARLVPPTAVVFDVGAYAGQYTKLFARAANHGRVYAFEPGSYARSILRTVVWLHGLSNVAVVPMALGSEARLDTLTIPLKSSGSFGFGLSHLGKPSERWRAVAQEIVAATTVDSVVKTLDLDRLDFIKADIEGWELRLLHGAESTLDRFRPRLHSEIVRCAHVFRAISGIDGSCFYPVGAFGLSYGRKPSRDSGDLCRLMVSLPEKNSASTPHGGQCATPANCGTFTQSAIPRLSRDLSWSRSSRRLREPMQRSR